MENRFRHRNAFANLIFRNRAFVATPAVTSSLQSGSTSARLYSVTLIAPNDVGITSTGGRRSTIWPFWMSTDSDGLLPMITADLTASTNGAQGGVVLGSTLNFSRGHFVTNATGHCIAAFTASTAALSTSFINVLMPDGTKLPGVSLTLT